MIDNHQWRYENPLKSLSKTKKDTRIMYSTHCKYALHLSVSRMFD